MCAYDGGACSTQVHAPRWEALDDSQIRQVLSLKFEPAIKLSGSLCNDLLVVLSYPFAVPCTLLLFFNESNLVRSISFKHGEMIPDFIRWYSILLTFFFFNTIQLGIKQGFQAQTRGQRLDDFQDDTHVMKFSTWGRRDQTWLTSLGHLGIVPKLLFHS
jgi:hypothetical protein